MSRVQFVHCGYRTPLWAGDGSDGGLAGKLPPFRTFLPIEMLHLCYGGVGPYKVNESSRRRRVFKAVDNFVLKIKRNTRAPRVFANTYY